MSVTQAIVGTLYIQNFNNIPFTQPGGAFSTVYPTLGDGPMTSYPVPGQFIAPSSMGLFHPGCGHSTNCWRLFLDHDDTTGLSAMVVACEVCSYIVHVIEPASAAYDGNQFPIIVG